ncbi:class GN sortase [Bowmanella sp. JS7-9]|uniref:Class GN sortase n=1 Tax=Pseudobowmanella zhangzhouensis TaxID=1537679 RepID=A0ABW1XMR6_9ALTE|nr:class GN sortase [Bowmanella sp. JS7-9]TBX23731.1 hypothetical protein TK45_06465 [Bowmanella sp. JS7-9]
MPARKHLIVGGLILLASWQAFAGGYIWLKAHVAQYLIAEAWYVTVQTGEQAKPWRWADTYPLGRLTIAEDDSFVLAGSSGRTLAFAPGHVTGTALPGESGNIVLAAHRDTHFARLAEASLGDDIWLESARGTRHYRIANIQVVSESDTQVLHQKGDDRLTLITCYPFDGLAGQATQRMVVTALPVGPAHEFNTLK